MAYSLQTSRTEFRGGKNILASEHVQYVHGGATFQSTALPVGIVPVGSLVARNKETGYFEIVTTADKATHDQFGILNEDFENKAKEEGVNYVVGAIIIEGSVYEAKLPAAVDQTFKDANPNIHYVNHTE